jgi:hypothetical protein
MGALKLAATAALVAHPNKSRAVIPRVFTHSQTLLEIIAAM